MGKAIHATMGLQNQPNGAWWQDSLFKCTCLGTLNAQRKQHFRARKDSDTGNAKFKSATDDFSPTSGKCPLEWGRDCLMGLMTKLEFPFFACGKD